MGEKVIVDRDDLNAVLSFRDGTELYESARERLEEQMKHTLPEAEKPASFFEDEVDENGMFKLKSGYTMYGVVDRDIGRMAYHADIRVVNTETGEPVFVHRFDL